MRYKAFAYAILGIAVGVVFAKFSAPNYAHSSVILKENSEAKPIFIKKGIGRKTLALTIKNLQGAAEVRVDIEGGRIESVYPPPMVLSFRKWPALKDSTLTGLTYGDRVPVYIALDEGRESYELLFSRISDNRMLLKVPIVEGERHGPHH